MSRKPQQPHLQPLGRLADDPTADEIRFGCEAFQETWTENERRRRAGLLDAEDEADNLLHQGSFGVLDGML
jgi:hypothetical protein